MKTISWVAFNIKISTYLPTYLPTYVWYPPTYKMTEIVISVFMETVATVGLFRVKKSLREWVQGHFNFSS